MYEDHDLSGEHIFDENLTDLKAGFIQSRPGFSQNSTSQYGTSAFIKRLLSVTALMLSRVEQDPEDANRLVLDGLEVSTVSIVGIITSINHQSTYTAIILNDGTGNVEIQKWNRKINENEMDLPDNLDITLLGMSVRVIGSLRVFNKSVSVSTLDIRPVSSLDEISSHIAYVVYSYLKLKSGNENNFNGKESNVVYHDISMVSTNGGTSDTNRIVLDALKLFSDFAQGVKRNKIYSMLKDHATEEQINTSINTLIREGLAYVTINYDYVKAL